jgi:hypothetical protein
VGSIVPRCPTLHVSGSLSEQFSCPELGPIHRTGRTPLYATESNLSAREGKHRLSAKREPDIQFALIPIKNQM